MDETTTQLLQSLVAATRASNAIPAAGNDFEFYMSYPGFRERMNGLRGRLQTMITRLVNHDRAGSTRSFYDDDALFDAVVEQLDTTLERVDNTLDATSGRSSTAAAAAASVAARAAQSGADGRTHASAADKALMTSTGSASPMTRRGLSDESPIGSPSGSPKPNGKQPAPGKGRKGGEFVVLHAKGIARPQLTFADRVDNSNVPFVPLVPLAPATLAQLTPLQREYMAYAEQQRKEARPLGVLQNTFNPKVPFAHDLGSFPHPYERELLAFEPAETQLTAVAEQLYRTDEETPFTWIDSEEELIDFARRLSSVSEFAIDLEHHSYRSLQGFVCLMQVSTRTEDVVIDTLAVRSSMHHLREVFANPNILKVFHGADMDVVWLQHDFGIYTINMFDTGQAARVLELGSYSLAHLLRYFCNVTADKKYQLADWRIRPIPAEMLQYAREDTHYLLYIYDRLRNELVSRSNESSNLLRVAYAKSRDVCLKTYEKPLFDPENSHMQLFLKHSRTFGPQQMQVFKALFAWRDRMGREEDESTGYVLPNHMLFHIAEALPTESAGILACCIPVPPLVRLHVTDLVQLIKRAREEALAATSSDAAAATGSKQATAAGVAEPAPTAAAAGSPATRIRALLDKAHASNSNSGAEAASMPVVPAAIATALAASAIASAATSSKKATSLQATSKLAQALTGSVVSQLPRAGGVHASPAGAVAMEVDSAGEEREERRRQIWSEMGNLFSTKRSASEMEESEAPAAAGAEVAIVPAEARGEDEPRKKARVEADDEEDEDVKESAATTAASKNEEDTSSSMQTQELAPATTDKTKSKKNKKPQSQKTPAAALADDPAAKAVSAGTFKAFDYKTKSMSDVFVEAANSKTATTALNAVSNRAPASARPPAPSETIKVEEPKFGKSPRGGVRSKMGERSMTSAVGRGGFQRPSGGPSAPSAWPRK
ncbi:exosome component 10 protein [Capsaspora owczarzaki ATCC 30864]|uniref:Exosome complex component 10 n=1 Tax=Capsaspora owczarzaki (strain ATCC 30864) TaxID=595528 RepID=A0A0D2U959_CAPO3|nr:exosome component 10 protein [Capsaspora owczarzaki ATCC 30864]KJE91581.1 exosome component 10 protein [Capsaspora owczarzaki ATCC 30864]|eukprot:XP_004349453.1 exosome component 10 protein [Capsaspora owczarzaki ATCC 30864]